MARDSVALTVAAPRRRRRLRAALPVALLACLAAAYGIEHTTVRRPAVERIAGGPVVNVGAFAHHGKLAFVSHGALWVLDGAHGTLRRLPSAAGSFAPQSPMFSPDGKWLAYLESSRNGAAPPELWLSRGDGSDAHVVRGIPDVTLLGWSPRRDLLAVAAGPQHTRGQCPCYSPTTLRLVSPDGSSRELLSGPWVHGAVWSPSGDAIGVGIVGQRMSTLASYPVSGGSPTVWLRLRAHDRLNGMNETLIEPAGWWPGFGIGFWVFGDGMVHNNDSTPLDVVAAPGARPKLLGETLSDGTTRAIAASPAGRLALVADAGGGRVVWQDKQVEVCTARSRSCSPLRHAASKVTVDPAWSPDGRTLAFAQAPNLAFPGWPQGLLQRWYAHHLLRLYDVRTRRVRTIRAAQGATVPTWSPDGKSLLYVAGDGLWLLPSLAGRPVEIAAPLFPRSAWPAYYGQVAWTAQFAWSAR